MADQKACPRCGQFVTPDAVSCPQCGFQPGAAAQPQQAQPVAQPAGQQQGPLPQAPAYNPALGMPVGPAGPVDPPGPHPRGLAVLGIGIMSLFIWLLGPVAWAMGSSTRNEIDAWPERYSNGGSVNTGRVLGMVSTGLLSVGLIFAMFGASYVLIADVAGEDGIISSRGGLSECKDDTKALKKAMIAWNTEYLSSDPNDGFDTAWPQNEADLVRPSTKLLQSKSELHDLKGVEGGASPPRILKEDGACRGEKIKQYGS